jgi:tetratricopeptide (TPR) repeat protein
MHKTNSSGHAWAHGYFNALKSITMADLGLFEAARERQISYLSSPEKQDDQISDGWSFLDLARSEMELGEYESAQQYLQAAAELGKKTGYSLFIGRSLAFQAYAILLEGKSAAMQDGLDLPNQAVNLFRGEDLRDYNGKLWYGEALKTLTSLHLLLGNLIEALEASQEVLTLLETPPVLPKPHEIHYIHSRVLTALGRESEADEYLQQAHSWVMQVAATLTDAKLRQSWFANIRTNREIVKLWIEHGDK